MNASSPVLLPNPDDRRDGRRMARDRGRPLIYGRLNERLNGCVKRGTKNSFTGQVSAQRFFADSEFRKAFPYRDTAEMNLAKYLEASPGVMHWGRRTSPLTWLGTDGVYQTSFQFEVWRTDGMQLIAIVDDDISEHERWGKFVLEIARGHVFYVNQSDLFFCQPIHPKLITLDFVAQQPWSSVLPKATADLLLHHRSTNLPEVTAAIV